jgi:tetratricopeptide (TPR) repeat protein
MKLRLLVIACVGLGFAGPAFAPARAETPSAPAALSPEKSSRAREIDELYARLAVATDPEEAGGIVGAIGRDFVNSDSDTANLLMARGIVAMQQQNYEAGEAILDSLVKLDPDWAEAWNKRATLRYLDGDIEGSMADIAQTLKREPRHLGALSGMGMIFEARGQRDQALKVYQRALSIAPHWRGAIDPVERLKAALAGESL